MIQAISACPTTIAEILSLAERIEKDEMRVDEVVDGLVDPDSEEEPAIAEMAEDEEDIEAEIEARTRKTRKEAMPRPRTN